MAYVQAGYVKPGYVQGVVAPGVPGAPAVLIPFVGANARLGATIMGARGMLDIPNFALLLASLLMLGEGSIGGA